MDDFIYLGNPGALTKLYWPSGGINAPRIRASSVFNTGTGGTRMSKLLTAARTYTLDYAGLGRENWAILEAYDQGHMGPGPFVLLDPGRRNLLTVNQSASTSQTNDTTGFTLTTDATGHSISSDSTQKTDVPRTLKWFFPATPTSTLLTLDSPSTVWPGIPVIRRQYTFACACLGLLGSIDFQVEIDWLDLAGTTVVGTATSGIVSSLAGTWLTFAATGTPPASAVWARCYLNPSNASIAAGEGLYLTDFIFNEGPREPWSPGTGIYPVQVVSQADITPYMAPEFKRSNTLVLQEVVR